MNSEGEKYLSIILIYFLISKYKFCRLKKDKKKKNDTDEYGQVARQWKFDKYETKIKRKANKGHYYHDNIGSLLEPATDPRLLKPVYCKQSNTDLNSVFHEELVEGKFLLILKLINYLNQLTKLLRIPFNRF